MAHITVTEAQAWLEGTKLTIGALDTSLETQVASVVLAQLSNAYTVTAWTDNTSTPSLVRTIIAMKYAAWFYRRQYSENADDLDYADKLDAWADSLIAGIVSGAIALAEVPVGSTVELPSYYPTDTSVDANGNIETARFTMGQLL